MNFLIQMEPTNLGYYLIDHSAGGILPAGITERVMERATYTCTHCQRVVVMNPDRKRERYTCRGCSHMICDTCAADRAAGAPCRTYRQKMDEILEAESRGLIDTNSTISQAQAMRQAEASSTLP